MKVTLFYSMLFLTMGSSFAIPYNQIRENFKSGLFNRQRGLMDQEQYFSFIEPYLQKAEKTLAIPQYCKNNSDNQLCEDYFMCLLHYNVISFHNYVRPDSPGMATKFALCANELINAIKLIKQEAQLADVDVEKEFNATTILLQEANKAYYKRLSIRSKVILQLNRYYSI